MDRSPIAVGILKARGNLFPMLRLVRLDHPGSLCLHPEIHAVVGKVGDRVCLLGDELRQRLTGILVVEGNIIAEISLDRLDHGGPVRPFRRAVIADHVGGLRRDDGTSHNDRQHEQDFSHELSFRDRTRDSFIESGCLYCDRG